MNTSTSINQYQREKKERHFEYPKANPNFIVIGGQKCATTWLFKLMVQHPQIYIPKCKEVNFYNKTFNYGKGIEWYRNQYVGYGGERAIGECTPNYLWTTSDPEDLTESNRTENIPALVQQDYPNMRLIAVLREPVDRAISAFYHHLRARYFPPNTHILDVCTKRGILSMGYYDTDLRNWFRYFPRNQFLILFYDDVKKNPFQVIKQIFRFLEVDTNFVPQHINSRYNIRYGSTYLYLHYYLPLVSRLLKVAFPPIIRYNWPDIKVTSSERYTLKQIYKPHVKRLENLMGKPTPWDY